MQNFYKVDKNANISQDYKFLCFYTLDFCNVNGESKSKMKVSNNPTWGTPAIRLTI